jgi:hypothetical protein
MFTKKKTAPGTLPDAGPSALAGADPGMARAEALAAVEAARGEVQRIQHLRYQREIEAEGIRAAVGRAEQEASAAASAVAVALAARELGDPDAPDDEVLAALRRAFTDAGTKAEEALKRVGEAAELEGLARALVPRLDTAQERLVVAQTALRRANAQAAMIARDELAAIYMDAGAKAMAAFAELHAMNMVVVRNLGGPTVQTPEWAEVCFPGVLGLEYSGAPFESRLHEAVERFGREYVA